MVEKTGRQPSSPVQQTWLRAVSDSVAPIIESELALVEGLIRASEPAMAIDVS